MYLATSFRDCSPSWGELLLAITSYLQVALSWDKVLLVFDSGAVIDVMG